MKVCGLAAVMVLVLVVKDVLSACPEGGCKCGESCVDINNRWCNSDKASECSCKRGCLLFDRLLNSDDSQRIYCRTCYCPPGATGGTDGGAWCTRTLWCKPDDITLSVDYPYEDAETPTC